jgi:hypothetical protein
VEILNVDKLCKYCKTDLKKLHILSSIIYVCYNDECIYLKQNIEGDICKRYAEDKIGRKINFEAGTPSCTFDE